MVSDHLKYGAGEPKILTKEVHQSVRCLKEGHCIDTLLRDGDIDKRLVILISASA